MIKFSESKQSFYADNLNYPLLPDDLVEVTTEQHTELLTALNRGCRVFSDLSTSDARPSPHHTWTDGAWTDARSDEEKQAQYLRTLKPLTRRQLKLVLLQNNLLEQVDTAIASISDAMQRQYVQIEYAESTTFERSNPSVIAMLSALELSDEQVNSMWQQAMSI